MPSYPTEKPFSRRRLGRLAMLRFTAGLATVAGGSLAFPLISRAYQDRLMKRPPILGTTFSQLQCYYMELDWQATFKAVASLGFDRIRLCAYWHEIEATENNFNFSQIDWLLEECDRRGIEVILAVGMKVPRWPEFHFPDWLRDRYDIKGNGLPLDANPALAAHGLSFLQRVVDHLRPAPAITHWQVENEPFTHLAIAGGRFLSYQFVRQEVELVRSWARPEQKILLTGSITLPTAQDHADQTALKLSMPLADAFGLNVYTKVPLANTFFYLEPLPPFWRTLRQWQTTLVTQGKEAWVAEAQAEPWEPNQLVAMAKPDYPSATPRRTAELVTTLAEAGYSTILLWGCEYWYWHHQQRRNQWWKAIQQLIRAPLADTTQASALARKPS